MYEWVIGVVTILVLGAAVVGIYSVGSSGGRKPWQGVGAIAVIIAACVLALAVHSWVW